MDRFVMKDCPESLQDLCVMYCVNNLDIITQRLSSQPVDSEETSTPFSYLLGNKLLNYYTGSFLPNEVSENYIDTFLENSEICSEQRDIFSPKSIEQLSMNKLRKLELTYFGDASSHCYNKLVEKNIVNLQSIKLFQDNENVATELLTVLGDNIKDESLAGRNLKSFTYIQLQTQNTGLPDGALYTLLSRILARHLNIQTFRLVCGLPNVVEWFLCQPHLPLFENLQSLTLSVEHQDLSSMDISDGRADIGEASSELFFENLPLLKSLRHLSLTSYIGTLGMVRFDARIQMFVAHDPEVTDYTQRQQAAFIEAIKQMPQIKSLDISGTNLQSIIGHQGYEQCRDHCMPGFEGREFEFLGLYGSATVLDAACKHKFIPALSVSGDASIEQLVAALWSLQNNKLLMKDVLQDIYKWIQPKYNPISLEMKSSIVEGLISYLGKFREWKIDNCTEYNIQHVLLCLNRLLRDEDLRQRITTKQKRLLLESIMVVSTVLIQVWPSDWQEKTQIIKLGLKMLNFVHSVVQYSYKFSKYIQFLMLIVNSSTFHDNNMTVLFYLHSACRFSQECKVTAGRKLHVVEKLLLFIQKFYRDGKANIDVMQKIHKVWSILWTLTDDVSTNCELFVEKLGCEIGTQCIKFNRGNDALIREIIGAMSNVAENAHLRSKLMTTELVNLFRDLLSYKDGGDKSDVSFHAASYLIKLAADAKSWSLTDPSREVVLDEIDKTINGWTLKVANGVRFRTLKPMLEQITKHDTPVAQLWGAWLIRNLVITEPMVYCKLLVDEGGIEVINEALVQGNLREDVSMFLYLIRGQTLHRINTPQSGDSA